MCKHNFLIKIGFVKGLFDLLQYKLTFKRTTTEKPTLQKCANIFFKNSFLQDSSDLLGDDLFKRTTASGKNDTIKKSKYKK